MIFPNISIGRNTKRYTHNMSFDNNTTLPFGVVQPLMSQRLEPNAKISVNMRQLVRLAPMPVPTFARLNMTNEVCFVPTVDVCPYYEALVSQMSFTGTDSTYYPTELPRTSNSFLVYYLLTQFDDVYYSAFDKNGNLVTDTSKLSLAKVQNALFNAFFGVGASTTGVPSLQEEFCQTKKDNFISVDAADYVVRFGDDGDDTTQFYLCFRLTESARRFRSVLVGLGYSLNASDHSSVSIIPILSYYKAWFDLYYPVRDLNWTDTNAYKVIKYIENYRTRFTEGYVKQYHVQAFIDFLRDLHNTFYTSKDDIVSVHRASISLSPAEKVPSFVDFSGNSAVSVSKASDAEPYVSASKAFGLVSLQALQRFTRYFAKNSVIGKRISSYVKVHYGAAVANSLYKDANHIGSYSYPLSVDDVMSSSDTFDVSTDTAGNSSSSGELLGAYAGKGIGFDKSSFDFTAPTFGYFFVLSSVSTPTGYFQGNSGDLYVVDFDHVPNPSFDCLGYEISPRGQFISYNDIVFGNDDSYQSLHITDGFGYVPRYTGLKYHKNIVNGDISRRSTADSLSAYHLNRIITPFTLTQAPIDSSSTIKGQIDYKSGDVPSASTSWRFLTRQPWLGDYNRIFYNHGDLYPADHWHGDLYGPDDNFIVQTVFDVRVTDQYKPLSQAWDTYEESTDDSSVDVKPE